MVKRTQKTTSTVKKSVKPNKSKRRVKKSGDTAKKTPANTQVKVDIERERLISLVNSMADGVIAVDEKGKVVVSNGAALNILDSNALPTGRYLHRVLNLVDKNNQPVDIDKTVLQTKTSTSSRDWKILYDDGSTAHLYTSIAPVRLGYGKDGMRGHVLLLRDITREKSLEEERDEFISVVSHELRTPIAIAEGNVSNAVLLFQQAGIDNPVVGKALSQAHDQITFLSGMMNDLATLSRAERGKLTLEVERINTHDLVTELFELYESEAKEKGLKLQTEIDPELEYLETSKLYTKEVLQNFITNAIKYTEEGHVTIGAKQRSNGVEFYVEDSGIGISKADKEKVFDKFFRSEDFRTRANSGSGLGLYVTMKLARLLHAEIDVESELNHGSTFHVFVPNVKAT